MAQKNDESYTDSCRRSGTVPRESHKLETAGATPVSGSLKLVLATIPFDRPFEWGKWDCFQLCCWARSTLAPELTPLPDMRSIYEKYPTEQDFPLDGVRAQMLEVCKSQPLYKRSRNRAIEHLDILVLSNGDQSNLGTAVFDDSGQVWVVMMGWTAHIIPIDRLGEWRIEAYSYEGLPRILGLKPRPSRTAFLLPLGYQ